MAVSTFDLFKIGIGPSSSHTVGPMKAAKKFVILLKEQKLLDQIATLSVDLYGSLGLTGRGHGTDKAIILGLEGDDPETVEISTIEQRIHDIKNEKKIKLLTTKFIPFDPKQQLTFHHREQMPLHPNGMCFTAKDTTGKPLQIGEYYSVGGGFILEKDEMGENQIIPDSTKLPFAFYSGDELLAICKQHQLTISQVMLENEKVWRSQQEIENYLLEIWEIMQACVKAGCKNAGVLPGGLKVKRRAPALYEKLKLPKQENQDQLNALDWVNLYALAINEENAAGGRIVTAPTNGAAGIIPAVMHYYQHFTQAPTKQGIIDFLLTAAAIGILFKENASISGAEVGCQGEVGVACSMAAGGLTAALNGSTEQIENAAEIGMEHNLGLTCDPIAGLVQIPCIERNAMGAVKAINAQRMAMSSDGKHRVSLDKVIKTMRETGRDMQTKYKETSRGGLAVNVIEC